MDKNLFEFIKFVSDNKNETEIISETPKNTLDSLFDNLTLFKETNTNIATQEIISETISTEQIKSPIDSLLHEIINQDSKPVNKNPVKQTIKEQSDLAIQEMLKRINFLESQIANMAYSSGGGSGSIIDIDKPTITINTDYTVGRKDYYIGVNSSSSANITLGNNSLFYGKTIIIKDESGNCSNNQINILGNIDSDANGAVLSINNSALTLMYTKTGWKII